MSTAELTCKNCLSIDPPLDGKCRHCSYQWFEMRESEDPIESIRATVKFHRARGQDDLADMFERILDELVWRAASEKRARVQA